MKFQSIRFASLYFLLMFLGTTVAFGKNLVFAKVLTVSEFGYLALFNIGVSYISIFFQFGLLNGLNRELPVALGRGENERAVNLRNMVVTCIGILVVICFVILAAILFWVDGTFLTKSVYVAAYMGAAISVFYGLVVLELRGRQLLLPFSFVYLLQALIFCVGGIVGGFYFGLRGTIVAFFLSYAVVIAIALKYWICSVRIGRIKIQEIKYLFRIGIPLVVSTFCFTAAVSMDRLFITKYFGVFELGQYQFAYLVFTAGMALSGIVAQWVFPQIMYNHGKGLDPAKGFHFVLFVIGGIAIVLSACWYPFLLISRFLLGHIFPKYVDALPLLGPFYFAGGLSVMNLAGVMVNVFNRQFLGMMGSIAVALMLFFLYLIAGHIKASMLTFAQIFLAGQISFVVMNTGLAFWCVTKYNSTREYL